MLIVEQSSGVVVEANPAAESLLDIGRIDLIGTQLSHMFAESSAAAFSEFMATTHASGFGKQVRLPTRRANVPVEVTLSLVRAGADSYLLVRLATCPLEAEQQAAEAVSSVVLDLIEESSEGFVLTDLGLRVTYANPAFATLAGVEAIDGVIGRSLAQWLELSQTDLTRLREQMSLREAAEIWTALLRQSSGLLTTVEITAVAVPDGEDACWGFRVAVRTP